MQIRFFCCSACEFVTTDPDFRCCGEMVEGYPIDPDNPLTIQEMIDKATTFDPGKNPMMSEQALSEQPRSPRPLTTVGYSNGKHFAAGRFVREMNDGEYDRWLDLVDRALPDHEVDFQASCAAAQDQLDNGLCC